jgi:N-acetylglutamate synthase-like GNAT family acetyltransferase
MGYELVEVTDPVDWVAYHAIRRQELFEARGRHGIYNENHPHDRAPNAYPYLLKLDGRPLGTARLDVRDDGTAVFRLVAITGSDQGKGHGRVMGQMIEDRARAFGTHTVFLNAADTAVGFYRATGWHEHVWDQTELDTFAQGCTQMRKSL